jgi:hypothetical protein
MRAAVKGDVLEDRVVLADRTQALATCLVLLAAREMDAGAESLARLGVDPETVAFVRRPARNRPRHRGELSLTPLGETPAAGDDELVGTSQAPSPARDARRRERRTLNAYRVTAPALLAVLVVTSLAVHQADRTAPPPAAAAVICAVMLGCAYYLGRTRPPRGRGQRLNWRGRIISVIPGAGLMLLPMLEGLYRLTRRRLYVRNIAICAGWGLIATVGDDPSTGPGQIMVYLQLAGIGLAVLISRRLPANVSQPPVVPAVAPPAAQPPVPTPVAPASAPAPGASPPAAIPISVAAPPAPTLIPAADQIVIVSLVAAAARGLYWLVGGLY